jgi:hypothetical protein
VEEVAKAAPAAEVAAVEEAPAPEAVVAVIEAPKEPEVPKVVVDWAALQVELVGMAEEALTNRARKVRDLVHGAPATEAGVKAAIDKVPGVSLLFVDSSRLVKLADEMRARVTAAEAGN